MKRYQHKGWQTLTMIYFMCLALAGATTLTACSDDDPHFTVTEDDYPRILNTDLSDKTIDRETPLQMEVKVTPIQYTTVTWLLNDVQIAEGTTINQLLTVGKHVLKIVATTTKGKSTSRTINVIVRPAAGDPIDPELSMEKTLWEGSFDVTWGTPFDKLKDDMVNLVHAGSIVRAYVTGNGQGSMTTAWWNNILTGKGDPERGDIMIEGDQVLEYTFTEQSMSLMNEQNGFLIVGDGYTVTKVTAE